MVLVPSLRLEPAGKEGRWRALLNKAMLRADTALKLSCCSTNQRWLPLLEFIPNKSIKSTISMNILYSYDIVSRIQEGLFLKDETMNYQNSQLISKANRNLARGHGNFTQRKKKKVLHSLPPDLRIKNKNKNKKTSTYMFKFHHPPAKATYLVNQFFLALFIVSKEHQCTYMIVCFS